MTIRTREDLLNWLAANAPSKSVSRAFHSEGRILLLGAFRPLPDSNYPGWIVMAGTRFRDYYVAVSIRPDGMLNTYLCDYVDWKCYDGEGAAKLYAGDRPERAAVLKRARKFQIVKRLEVDNA